MNSLKISGSRPNSNFFNSISDNDENVKQKQLEILEKVNPAPNSYNTWIRQIDDIKTLSETLENYKTELRNNQNMHKKVIDTYKQSEDHKHCKVIN